MMDTASTAVLAILSGLLVLHIGCTQAQQAAFTTPYDSSADCENHTLAALNQSAAFNVSGYALSITWQPSFDPVWQSLTCLNALTSLSITGPLPQLPDSWSTNGSFTALQSLDLAGGDLLGMLAASRHPHPGPCLTCVIMSSTSHSIQLAFAMCLLCCAAALACIADCMTTARLCTRRRCPHQTQVSSCVQEPCQPAGVQREPFRPYGTWACSTVQSQVIHLCLPDSISCSTRRGAGLFSAQALLMCKSAFARWITAVKCALTDCPDLTCVT